MLFSVALALAALASRAAALGTTCSSALGAGTAAVGAPFWLETITHQGTSAYNPNPSSYQVFRNVKNFGAKGDGVTDDTAAINAAITSGGRPQSGTSSLYPAVVYFPKGTYQVSGPINALYYTQLVGDARTPPTLRATSGFSGPAIIDADPAINGAPATIPKENFYRSVRNLVIDTTARPTGTGITGIHWRVSKGTSLYNIVFNLGGNTNNNQGIFIEDGSGGFIGDLIINGGKYGLNVGSQQFTTRNVTVNNAATGVLLSWASGWTFQGVNFNNVAIGFDVVGDTSNSAIKGVGSVAIIDSVATNVATAFLRTSGYASRTENGGSIVLNNIKLTTVPTYVLDATTGPVLRATSSPAILTHWEQGSAYVGPSNTQAFDRGTISGPTKPSVLVNSAGSIVGRGRPQYADYAVSQFVSVKSLGARGDGHTDDTATLQAVFAQYAGCKIIFFDAGTYVVSHTLSIPIGAQIVGEAWSVIVGTGPTFENVQSPVPVVQVGSGPFQFGTLEISDIIFGTLGPAPGAIVVEWNAHDGTTAQATVGAWDTHIRLGSTVGSNNAITAQTCGSASSVTNPACIAAFLGLHLTVGSSAYLEGLWVWLGDYDLDNQAPVYALSGRGILSETQGPVWLIGTAAENHAIYQYNIYGASNHYLGFVQGETPSYENGIGLPIAPNTNTYHDPIFAGPVYAWGLYITQSVNGILVFGGGFYSPSTQNDINFVDAGLSYSTTSNGTYIYALNTVGATNVLTTAVEIPAAANQAGASGQATLASWSTVH